MKTNNKKQVAAFDQVLGLCNDLGQKYNPGSDSINLAALNQLRASAEEKVKAAQTANSHLTELVNARQEAFAPIAGIGTRILNVLIASDASPQLIADVKRYRDKLRSPRPGKTVKPEEGKNPKPADASRGPLSYLDYESRLVSFRSIVDLINGSPAYKPNEPEFTIDSLYALAESLDASTKAVNEARLNLTLIRRSRNVILYTDTGLYGITKRVKKYILFAFGTTSLEYRSVKGIILKAR